MWLVVFSLYFCWNSEKINIGIVFASFFGQLGIHEHETTKNRQRKAGAGGG